MKRDRYEVKLNERATKKIYPWQVWDRDKKRTICMASTEATAESAARRLNSKLARLYKRPENSK